MTALALVESPVQLLHVIEWCHATDSGDRTSIAVLAPRDATSRLQLRTMQGYAMQEGIETRWHEPRQGAMALWRSISSLRRRVAGARRLVVGDPFSGLVQILLAAYHGGDVVVVDDGTSTMEFAARLAEETPLERWDARDGLQARLRRPSATRARRLLTPSPGRQVTVFTVMPLGGVPGLAIHPNRYDWTRRRFGRPAVTPGADVIGTSLVESGVVAEGAYLKQIAAIVEGSGRYSAHRREGAGKLARIAELTGLQVVRPEAPLEIELCRGPVAEQVVSFPSSVGYTLPVALASVGTQVRMVPVQASWLRPEVSARARSFLTAIVANQAAVSGARRSASRR